MKQCKCLIFLLSLLFILFLTSVSETQSRSTPFGIDDIRALVKIKGWIGYRDDTDLQKPKILSGQMDVTMKKNNKYKIIDLKLNGKKFSYQYHRRYYDYSIILKPYPLKVGENLVLEMGIARKHDQITLKNVEYYTIATFQVKNLFKKTIFPAPNQTINLSPTLSSALDFKWQFTNFIQKTRVLVRQIKGKFFEKIVTGESCNIRKKDLKYGKDYEVELGSFWGPKNSFIFSKVVEKGSKLDFSHRYSYKFKTTPSPVTLRKLKIK